MNQNKYLEFHRYFYSKMIEIAENKSSDYSGVENIFNNFESVGKEWVEIGFFTRMMDKMSRLKSFIKFGTLKVKDESIKDTLMDLANYSILLAAYLEEQNVSNTPTGLK